MAALVDTVGQDLRELAGAVAKLHVAVPPPTVLTAGHVTEFLAQTADRGIFELTDAVFAADAATALDRLDALFDQGEDPIRLLGFIASQLRLLLRVADHPELPKGQVAELLGGGVRDWQVDRARRQLRRFRPGDLHRALDLIAEADAHIRNGTSSSRLLPGALVARLAGAGAPGGQPRRPSRLARHGCPVGPLPRRATGPASYWSCWLTERARRALWLAALFWWMTPLLAARSYSRVARRRAASAASWSPAAALSRTRRA